MTTLYYYLGDAGGRDSSIASGGDGGTATFVALQDATEKVVGISSILLAAAGGGGGGSSLATGATTTCAAAPTARPPNPEGKMGAVRIVIDLGGCSS